MKKWTIVFAVMAIVMLSVGVVRAENETVLNKGSNICLECVGIG